jgi:hypothetical protein
VSLRQDLKRRMRWSIYMIDSSEEGRINSLADGDKVKIDALSISDLGKKFEELHERILARLLSVERNLDKTLMHIDRATVKLHTGERAGGRGNGFARPVIQKIQFKVRKTKKKMVHIFRYCRQKITGIIS